MQDRDARKLSGGLLVEISPTKVPRLIGKQGSMISMIKEMTGTRIYVGQNGRIWIDGPDEGSATAVLAIRFIEDRAQAFGLTETVRDLLEKETRRPGPRPP
jgi:exosome complex component RRP4